MTNFLIPQEENSTASRRWLGIFLITIFVVGILGGFIFFARHYMTTRWVGFAEQVGKKITTAHWWPTSYQPPVVPQPQPLRPVRLAGTKSLNPDAFTARHLVVRDDVTGEMLFGKSAYEPWPIASITKLLSALVLLDTPLNFSATTTAATDVVYDNEIIPKQIYIVKDLWGAALVASSNRAVLSLVDASGLSREEFMARVNEKIIQLGLTNTHIFEPTGLDPKNTATAADIAIVISEALKKPLIRDSVLLSEYKIATADGRFAKTLKTTDWLVSGIIPKYALDIRGGKTGSIPEADYNFVFQVSSSTNHVVDIVVLGATNNDARFVEARQAAEWVYRSFEWK